MLKVTLFFHATTVDQAGNAFRAGGWTETLYTGVSMTGTGTFPPNLRELCEKRAALLPINTQIVAQRVQTVDPVGASRLYIVNFSGRAAEQNDLPQAALRLRLRGVTGLNAREYTVRGVPDARIVTGEYKAVPAYTNALLAFFQLVRTSYKMKGRDKSLPATPILVVGTDGVVVFKVAHALAVGDMVRLLRCEDEFRITTKGVFQVLTRTNDTSVTLRSFHSRSDRELIRGRIRKEGTGFLDMEIDDYEIRNPIATTHEVGEPFFQYVGRR